VDQIRQGGKMAHGLLERAADPFEDALLHVFRLLSWLTVQKGTWTARKPSKTASGAAERPFKGVLPPDRPSMALQRSWAILGSLLELLKWAV
jgi:hypothetical protein